MFRELEPTEHPKQIEREVRGAMEGLAGRAPIGQIACQESTGA
jgi:hypothetical protein